MGYQKIKMGSILGILHPLNETPHADKVDDRARKKAAFEISNTDAGLPIAWVQPDGMNILIADRAVCSYVSWSQLEEAGFAQGARVYIDGMPFLCRLPKVGEAKERPNEWDECLAAAGDDSDDLWHWHNIFFLGAGSVFVGARCDPMRSRLSWRPLLAQL